MRKAALLCGTLSLAVFVSFYLLPESVLLPAAGVCALLSALSLLLPRGKGRARAHLALLGAAIGLFAFFVQEHFLAAPSDALAGEKRVISVRVTDYPDIYDTSEYITVRVRDPDLPGVKCRIASYDTENFTALTPGDELSVPVKLLPARERNGQSVDTYAAQGIFLRATATGAPEITGRWDFSFLYAPKALCRAIGEICQSVFPPDVQPFLTALLTGDKTDLYDDGAHYYALADAGLAHVVAVSGMHIAFLMGFLFLLIGRRPWAVAVSLPVLLLFAAMTGFTPSVTRAAVMQFFLLAAPLFGRESDGVTSLLTALALLLLLNPSACASVSLQLSFSSVAGIWFLSNRMYRALSRRIEDLKIAENRHARRVLLFAAGSVSSSIGAMARALGYSEIITYSFISPSYYDKIRMPKDSPLRKSLKILNPLGEDTSIMRTTILPSMLEILTRNYNYRNKAVRLYEIGKVYFARPDGMADEPKLLCLGGYGGGMDFFQLKGAVERILAGLRITDVTFEAESGNPSYHPGRCAKVYAGGKLLGVFGQIHPLAAANYGVDTELYTAELQLGEMLAERGATPVYTPLPRFPAVTRDVAVVCSADIPVAKLSQCILAAGGQYLKGCELFDVYTGAPIPAGYKSVAFSLTLRADDQTLTDDHAEETMQSVLKALEETFHATIR